MIQGETWWLGPEYSSRGGRMARLGIYLEVELRGLAARLDRGWGGDRGHTEVLAEQLEGWRVHLQASSTRAV